MCASVCLNVCHVTARVGACVLVACVLVTRACAKVLTCIDVCCWRGGGVPVYHNVPECVHACGHAKNKHVCLFFFDASCVQSSSIFLVFRLLPFSHPCTFALSLSRRYADGVGGDMSILRCWVYCSGASCVDMPQVMSRRGHEMCGGWVLCRDNNNTVQRCVSSKGEHSSATSPRCFCAKDSEDFLFCSHTRRRTHIHTLLSALPISFCPWSSHGHHGGVLSLHVADGVGG